jgi:hypothetical protein
MLAKKSLKTGQSLFAGKSFYLSANPVGDGL